MEISQDATAIKVNEIAKQMKSVEIVEEETT